MNYWNLLVNELDKWLNRGFCVFMAVGAHSFRLQLVFCFMFVMDYDFFGKIGEKL